MNARQAAKAAAKRIEENERVLKLNKADIVAYNNCILSMIAGGSPCDYCEDIEECQLDAKGKGCSEWMLKMQRVTQDNVRMVLQDNIKTLLKQDDLMEVEADAGKGIHVTGT